MCRPHRRFAPLLSRTLRRIPQAVGVVATHISSRTLDELFQRVSIPRAVGTIAIGTLWSANGKEFKVFQYRKR